MKSSWSIYDFPAEEGETVLPPPTPKQPEVPRKLTEAEKFELIRNRPDRKGRGARRRAGEKKWATKGK
jgi:hypothetical protein